jgi:hypothetical protein
MGLGILRQKWRILIYCIQLTMTCKLLGICFWREGFEAAFGPERGGWS